jgi:hypothetical protein
VTLVDVEPGRSTWRIRAGALESPASSPLRELQGEEATRVLLAAGAGVAADHRPRGIATDGRLAVPTRGGAEWGALFVDGEGRLSFVRADDAPPIDAHADLLELPILVWDARAVSASTGVTETRSAIGVTASGRVVLARARSASTRPLADALLRAGCARALLLDRGAHATGFVDRAGGAEPPRGRYEESVLYAVAATMRPRAFHFDAASLYAQGASSR